MNNDFVVTQEVICQWFSLVTSSLVRISGKSPHSWPKKSLFTITHALFLISLPSQASSIIIFLVLYRISPFSTLYFISLFKIWVYSSSYIILSINALEIISLTESSFASDNILIFSCFSVFCMNLLVKWLPIISKSPVANADASVAITIGAAIIVERRPTPVASYPILIDIRTNPILFMILTAEWYCREILSLYIISLGIFLNSINFFSCHQAALWMVQSVCLSVCPSVCCHTFLVMLLSSYHHGIFESYYQWQKWRPCKRSRSEVKGQGHRGQHPS